MCDGPYKSCKSNRKNRHEYWSLTFLLKRFGDDLTGDPNAPAGGLGPPIPPLYSCKNLRIVWKRPTRRFLWFNPDFTSIAVPPPSSKADGGTPFLGKKFISKSPFKKCKISPVVRAPKASTGLRIRKCGSVAGPGIKIRTKVVRIRVPSPYPSKDGRIRTLIFLCLWLFFSLPLVYHDF